MPKIPTYYSKLVPSGQIGQAPIPTSAARSGAEYAYQGLADLGRGMANAAEMLARIEMDRIALSDDINFAKAKGFRDNYQTKLADLPKTTELVINKDGKTSWDIERAKALNEYNDQMKGLVLSKRGRAKLNALNEIWNAEDEINFQRMTQQTFQDKAKSSLMAALESAVEKGDDFATKDALENINKSRAWGDNTEEKKKAIAYSTKKGLIDGAILFPQETILLAQAKLESLKKGKVDDFGLDATDYNDIKNKAESILGTQRQHKGELYNLAQNENAAAILDDVQNNTIEQTEPTEENIGSYSVLQARNAQGILDIGLNDYLYQEVKNKLMGGGIADETDILNFSEVGSRRQIAEIRQLNEMNKKILDRLPEYKQIKKLVDSQYNELENLVMLEKSYSIQNKSELKTALDEDREYYLIEIKKALADKDIKIDKLYAEAMKRFEPTRKGIIESFYKRWFKVGIHDFVNDLETGKIRGPDGELLGPSEVRRKRLEAIIRLIQTGTKPAGFGSGIEWTREAIEAGWFRNEPEEWFR